MKVIVEIPLLPIPEGNPNWRGYWAQKARAVKVAREMAYYCSLFCGKPLKNPVLDVDISIKDKRFIRDPDNWISSAKPFIDGCVDAGIIANDRELTIRSITHGINKDVAPLTILNFSGEE